MARETGIVLAKPGTEFQMDGFGSAVMGSAALEWCWVGTLRQNRALLCFAVIDFATYDPAWQAGLELVQ